MDTERRKPTPEAPATFAGVTHDGTHGETCWVCAEGLAADYPTEVAR